jgi:hypothetical protein
VTRPLSLRLYRAPVDGSRTVFFSSIDRVIPLVDGVTIVGDRAELVQVVDAARDAGLAAVARRWSDGRRAVVIQDRRSRGGRVVRRRPFQRRQPFVARGCAGLSGLPCLHGPSTPHERCEIMGPPRPVTIEVARANVERFVYDATGEQRETLAAYIARTGHAILHAAHELFRTPVCHCAACLNPLDPRRSWLLDSVAITRNSGGAS